MGSLGVSVRNRLKATQTALQHTGKFLSLYAKHYRKLGAIAPSSAALTSAMVAAAPVAESPIVVEFGAGTGSFTKEILRVLPPSGQLLSFEIMPEFLKILQQRFSDPRLEIIPRSAAELADELDRRGIDKVRSFISGLPFNALPKQLSRDILSVTHERLSDDGVFVTFQHTPFQLKLFRSIFPHVSIARTVLMNMPPAIVVVCRR